MVLEGENLNCEEGGVVNDSQITSQHNKIG